MLFPLELKLCRTLWSVDVVQLELCTDLLGGGPAALVLRHTCSRKAIPAECRVAGFGVSSSGHQWWHLLFTEVS